MKDILKFIPGFRTQTKWKMIVAGIYYLISLLMLTNEIGLFLFFITIPFVLFSLVSLTESDRNKVSSVVTLALSIILCCSGIVSIGGNSAAKHTQQNKIASNTQSAKVEKSTQSDKIKKSSDSKSQVKTIAHKVDVVSAKIHFIDVGQGDSELIQCNGQNMLIDTGTNESTNSLINYLKNENIKKIDYLILTHPHEDHIGGADEVIKQFDIGTIYMPQVSTNTHTFRDVLTSMQNKGLKSSQPPLGTTFKVGDANCIIYGPVNTNSEDLNTYSIVVKLTLGNTKFLFTGDAQSSNESDMIANGYDLSADVLKVGHHGSKTSTSGDLLSKVTPQYAVISCGKNNDYGHPHAETMEKLKAKNIAVYRTDESGTIICTSDGTNISFGCKPGDYNCGTRNNSATQPQQQQNSTASQTQQSQQQNSQPASQPVQQPAQDQNQSQTVYVTNTGKKYHRAGCKYLRRSQIPISLKDAEAEGYTPCEICKP